MWRMKSDRISNNEWRSRALLSVAEVAAITGLGRATIWRLLSSGALPSVKIGKRRCVKPAAVEALIELAESGVGVSTGMEAS